MRLLIWFWRVLTYRNTTPLGGRPTYAQMRAAELPLDELRRML